MTIHIEYVPPYHDGPHQHYVTLREGRAEIVIPVNSERDSIILYGELISLITKFNDCILLRAHERTQP